MRTLATSIVVYLVFSIPRMVLFAFFNWFLHLNCIFECFSFCMSNLSLVIFAWVNGGYIVRCRLQGPAGGLLFDNAS